ncbi:MAG TPA: hypothetical protein VM427_04160 [Patescibacteria group bacterium]|nr:hypothetical protein [Patescibacteria group bacterium]
MTPNRATGPGPRTVALHHAASIAAIVAAIAFLALLVAACGTVGPSDGSPGTSPVASDPGGAGPSPSRWPSAAVEAMMALGAADAEIAKAGVDLEDAVNKQDLKAMWGAADGLAKMIDGLAPNVDSLESYEGTKPMADRYRVAFPDIGGGARQLRDAITAGDSAGVVAGSQRLAKGLAAYGPMRRDLGDLVEQAVLQKRLLVR